MKQWSLDATKNLHKSLNPTPPIWSINEYRVDPLYPSSQIFISKSICSTPMNFILHFKTWCTYICVKSNLCTSFQDTEHPRDNPGFSHPHLSRPFNSIRQVMTADGKWISQTSLEASLATGIKMLFILLLFIIMKSWKQSNCSARLDWLSK